MMYEVRAALQQHTATKRCRSIYKKS